MNTDPELLSSWAVEIDTTERSSLVLRLNDRSVRLPRVTAELLAHALRERSSELATGRVDGPANQP